MLGGIDPVIIFQFSKLAGTSFAEQILKIPLVSEIPDVVAQPPIPIYLSESLTGLFIDTEDKNVDTEVDIQTKTDGSEPAVEQKGVSSTVSINLQGRKDSLGIALLSAMIDLAFDKVTSKEYAITYLHGATTIFRGMIKSYSVNQSATTNLLTIKIELTKGAKQPQKKQTIVVVPAQTGGIPFGR